MRKLIVGILITALLAGYSYGIWWGVNDYNAGKDIVESRTYEGRLYLPAEEYEAFKKYLVDNPQVRIVKLDVLSSPNALVDMRLSAPGNTIVPYGEMTQQVMLRDFTTLVMGICVSTAFLVFAIVITHLFLLTTVP